MATPTDDAWQAQVIREAGREIGRWLQARGRLHQPIAALGLDALEGMATAAISRYVVLAAQRMRSHPQDDLSALLMPPGCAPSAAGRTGASATPTISAATSTPATASAPCAASMADRRSHERGTA